MNNDRFRDIAITAIICIAIVLSLGIIVYGLDKGNERETELKKICYQAGNTWENQTCRGPLIRTEQ